MLFVEAIVALVSAPILPHIVTVAVHHTFGELTLEVAAVSPLEAAVTTHLILEPRARVPAAVGPEVATFSLFDAIVEVSVIVAPVAPHFDAETILPLLQARQIR